MKFEPASCVHSSRSKHLTLQAHITLTLRVEVPKKHLISRISALRLATLAYYRQKSFFAQ